MHRTILVVTTSDDAGRGALALGVELARPTGARLVVGGVAGQPGGMRHELLELRGAVPADVPVEIDEVEAPSLVRGLHELAVDHEADLLVLGPIHRGPVRRALHGDVVAEAVFTAPCAIAVAAGDGVRPLRRIGVGWDGSPESDEALEWAVQLAERTGGTVEILRVVPRSRSGHPELDPAVERRLDEVRRLAERRAAATAKVLAGDAGEALALAGEELDLLVLGSRAQSPLRRALYGSVSADAVHAARCPVLVLPRGVHAPMDLSAV